MTERAVHFIDHLTPPLQREVEANFPKGSICEYEEQLYRVKRLSYGREYLPIKPGFEESDLEHTCAMLDILWELKGRFSYIPDEINFREVAYMIAMHDAGEIFVGDGPPFGPERESRYWEKRKRLEPKLALRKIIKQIPDQRVQEEMSHLHHRFTEQDVGDKEALLTRLIDKAQGTTRTGPDFAFNYRTAGWEQPSYKLIDHIQSAVSILIGAALNLHVLLPQEAKGELRQFTMEELDRFRPIGFSNLAAVSTQHFLQAIT